RGGSTPVIRARSRSRRRFSVAGLVLLPAWRRLPPDLRPKRHTDHKSGGRKGFAWTEYRDLIAAHQQPEGPIVLIWDNLNVHKDRRMRAFIDAQDWITARRHVCGWPLTVTVHVIGPTPVDSAAFRPLSKTWSPAPRSIIDEHHCFFLARPSGHAQTDPHPDAQSSVFPAAASIRAARPWGLFPGLDGVAVCGGGFRRP
ncbi:hypothetical protein ACFUC2_20685, partial [[Kitasatospora] papulosa]